MISLRALSSPSGLVLDCDILEKLHVFVAFVAFAAIVCALVEEFEEQEK